jgi:hypothetical protein
LPPSQTHLHYKTLAPLFPPLSPRVLHCVWLTPCYAECSMLTPSTRTNTRPGLNTQCVLGRPLCPAAMPLALSNRTWHIAQRAAGHLKQPQMVSNVLEKEVVTKGLDTTVQGPLCINMCLCSSLYCIRQIHTPLPIFLSVLQASRALASQPISVLCQQGMLVLESTILPLNPLGFLLKRFCRLRSISTNTHRFKQAELTAHPPPSTTTFLALYKSHPDRVTASDLYPSSCELLVCFL